MWLIIAIIGAVVYFHFFYQEPKKKKSEAGSSSKRQKIQNSKADIPGINWIFQPNIDAAGVPPIVNTYRKQLNGKTFEEIIKYIYVATHEVKDEMQSSLIFMQITEPLIELQALKYLDWDDVQYSQKASFEFLIMQYSIAGAIGQLKNIRDLYYFFNKEIPILEADLIRAISYVENEAQFRLALMTKLKTEEYVYQKDFKLIKGYDKIESEIYHLMEKLINTNQIEKSKQGKYVIYKLKKA